MATPEYEKLRQTYRPPGRVNWLLVTESPPPDDPADKGTRHFYQNDRAENDRLFWNTMRAIYPEAKDLSEAGLAKQKAKWLARFKNDGFYLIESLEQSLPHGTKTSERHQAIKAGLPELIKKIKMIADNKTKVILIKSTVYKIAAEELKSAGFNVINETFIDYPGYWREQQFAAKLSALLKKHS